VHLTKELARDPPRLLTRLVGVQAEDLRSRKDAVRRVEQARRWPFEVEESEGFWWLEPDNRWLAAVARRMPCPLADLLVLLGDEPGLVVSDEALVISWDDLRQRIVRRERFVRTHQTLPETQAEVGSALAPMFDVYVCGLDNTPAHDRRSGTLDPQLRASYERFLREDRDSRYWPLIDGLMKVLNKEGFLRTTAVEQYLKADSPTRCGRFR
jgi:hypothetical protein